MTLRDRLRAVVADRLGVDGTALTEGALLGEDLGLDSLAAIELAMVVEGELGVRLPDDVLAGVLTYGDLERAVAEGAPTLDG